MKKLSIIAVLMAVTASVHAEVGLDEHQIRKYVRDQEKRESGQGDLDLK